MILRRVLLISGILLFSGVMFSGLSLYKQEVEKDRILAKLDNRLDGFYIAQGIARDASKLVTISNNTEYTELSANMRKKMTTEVYNEYFPTKDYKGGQKDIQLRYNSVSGEIKGGAKYIFKLDMTIVNGQLEVPLILLVYIENERIYRIQSLG